MRVTVEMPTTLPSVANLREHWAQKSRRTRKLRRHVYLVLRADRWFVRAASAAREHGATITLTRMASRRLDTDNLAAAFKAVQDGVADALELKDGDRRLEWRYEQESGKPDRIRVSIDGRAPTLTPEQARNARLMKVAFEPVPPDEDEGGDPDYGL